MNTTHAMPPTHGGSDALGAAPWDFSTNSNAAGPCPGTLQALAAADATRYPDPAYTALREQLAAFHGVASHRVVVGASGSELIARITAWVAHRPLSPRPLAEAGWGAGHTPHLPQAAPPSTPLPTPAPSQQEGGQAPTARRAVWLPEHHYADYAHAAVQHGMARAADIPQADLIWLCAPTSPHGQALQLPDNWAQRKESATAVLDCAYAPLQLTADDIAPELDRNLVWQLWTPNKALGLCGIRAAYAIAPVHADATAIHALQTLAASWPLGAHGVALLQNWCAPATQQWLDASRATLRVWKQQQITLLHAHGWVTLPSTSHFFVAQPALPQGASLTAWLAALREKGIKLRDTASFGLPGQVRLCVHTPQAQQALRQALADGAGKAWA